MLNEKMLVETLSNTTQMLTETVQDRDQFKTWWSEGLDKIKERDKTIGQQHEEILKLNEELNTLRGSETIVADDHAAKEKPNADQHTEI